MPTHFSIAYLLPDVHLSGGAAVVFQHANRLKKRGHHLIVGSTGMVSQADWFPNQSVPVVKASSLPSDLDFIVATSWPTAFQALRHPARHQCYFVQSDETRFYEPNSPLFTSARLSYDLNVHFFTEARWIQRWLLENFGKCAALVPNGLDRDIFYPDTPLEPRTGKPRILLEGAIALPFKGMKEAFEAVDDLDAEVWCVSAYGRPKAAWKCDRFFEKVPMATMRRIYSSCDILLKLSRVEGFFGPPLEMMACGGLCVVGKVTGHDEYIRDRENAIVVEPNDVKEARKAVMELISDQDLQQTLRAKGAATAREWSWEASINQLEAFFYDIRNGGRPLVHGDRTNDDLLCAYEGILSETTSTGATFGTIAHRVKKKINNQLLLKIGERIYLHIMEHKELYSKIFRDKR